MKKLIAMLMILSPIMAMAQKIQKNEIDKFTKQRLVETKMETLAKFNKWKSLRADNTRLNIGVRFLNGDWVFPAMIVLDDCEKVTERNGVLFLLDNGETITSTTAYTGIFESSQEPGSSLWRFNTVLYVDQNDVPKLKNGKITDIRISVLGRNFDLPVEEGKQDLISRMITLIESKL